MDDFNGETNFETFWHHYSNKSGKGAARTAYEKQEKLNGNKKDFMQIVLAAIATQKKFRTQQKSKGQWVANWKNPTTWLNQECFCDEVMLEEEKKTASILSQCTKPDCREPIHGSRFTFCEIHEGRRDTTNLMPELQEAGRLFGKFCKNADDWREKYRELVKKGIGGIA